MSDLETKQNSGCESISAKVITLLQNELSKKETADKIKVVSNNIFMYLFSVIGPYIMAIILLLIVIILLQIFILLKLYKSSVYKSIDVSS